MEGGPPDALEPSRRAGPQSAPDQLEVSHQPGGLQVRKDQKAAVVSPQIWRSRLRRLTTAGHYAEAVEVIESGWDGSQLRGADRLLALVAVASEGRFELVDRLAEGVKGAGTPSRNDTAYQLGLLSVSPKVAPRPPSCSPTLVAASQRRRSSTSRARPSQPRRLASICVRPYWTRWPCASRVLVSQKMP